MQLTGRTFDAVGVELFGREALWTTSDANHATVDINGLVTGVSESQAAITFSSEGVTAQATITVASALFGSAHTSGGPASLYSIDPTTGAATLIGAIGFNRVGAMAVHPSTGVYYAAADRSLDATPVLITLNPTTGVGTEVGPTGIISGSVTDMSFRSNGTLYLFDGPNGGYNLHTVNLTTGAATAVGATFLSGDGNAMWFGASDVLYIATTVLSTTSLYSVSTLTASPTLVGAFTYTGAVCTSPVMNAADYDPLSGTTYASVRCFGGPSITAFARVDVGTLTINVIGPTVDRIDGVVNRR